MTTSLLDDYAYYLVCCLGALYFGKDEAKFFADNLRFRNMTYQLYVILEKIFGKYTNDMSFHQISLLKQAYKKIQNTLQIFFDDDILYQVANEDDIEIYQQLISPRIKDMFENLNYAEDVITVTTSSYHVDDRLMITLSAKAYKQAKQFIINTYNQLGNL